MFHLRSWLRCTVHTTSKQFVLFYSQSDLCVPTDGRCSMLLLHRIALNNLQINKPVRCASTDWGNFFFYLRKTPPVGHDPPHSRGFSRSLTTTHHSRWYSSERAIISSQRTFPDNTQNLRQTSMPPAEFEPAIPANERPQTYALDRAATGTGLI